MAVVMSPARQAWHERGEEGVLEKNTRLSTSSYPGEERASATLSAEETSGQDDAAARPPCKHSIPPGTDDEANNGDPEDNQNVMTLFSAVLAPNTFNTMVEDTDYTRAHRQIGVVLTNEVYYGVLIPDQHEGQEELNQSQIIFLKKPSFRLAGLVVKTILTVETPLLSCPDRVKASLRNKSSE